MGIEVEVTGSGKPVVLLHGFPDTGIVVAQPGSGSRRERVSGDRSRHEGLRKSDKPEGVEAYSIPFVVGDVLAVLDSLGIDRAHVVGHDWGAAIAWAMGSLVPDRVDQLVALSVGNPISFVEAGYEQREKSWYMLLFQFEGIAERWLSDNDWANLRTGDGTPTRTGHRGARKVRVAHPCVELLPGERPTSGPGGAPYGATSGASIDDGRVEHRRHRSHREADDRVERDHVSGPWRYERLEGPGHWMQLEAPDAVNELLLDFLAV